MDELDYLRSEIDAVDAQIVELYERRMEIAGDIGRYKRRSGLQVADAGREKAMVRRRIGLLKDAGYRTRLTELFELLMSQSRRLQYGLTAEADSADWEAYRRTLESLRVPVEEPLAVYSGQPGAFSEAAAALFFGEAARRVNVPDFEDVFEALRQGRGDYGVLPIENSSTGSISAVYDLLGRYGFYIVGEQAVKVEQYLMAPRGAALGDIAEVYSHEQGFSQSEAFLRAYPGWRRVVLSNTAESAKYVAEENAKDKAAIAGKQAAALYGLDILGGRINSSEENNTRFVVVSRHPEIRRGSDKVSAVFTVPHTPGSLHRMLTVFAVNGLNLLKLESRPIQNKTWEYMFFADFSGNLAGGGMEGAMRELMDESLSFRILGNYSSSDGDAQ